MAVASGCEICIPWIHFTLSVYPNSKFLGLGFQSFFNLPLRMDPWALMANVYCFFLGSDVWPGVLSKVILVVALVG